MKGQPWLQPTISSTLLLYGTNTAQEKNLSDFGEGHQCLHTFPCPRAFTREQVFSRLTVSGLLKPALRIALFIRPTQFLLSLMTIQRNLFPNSPPLSHCSVSFARFQCGTPRRLQGDRHYLYAKNLEKISLTPTLMSDHEEDCHHADCCHPEEEELAVGLVSYHFQPVSGRRSPNLRRSLPMVCFVVIELVLEDEVCGELDQIVDGVVDKFSWPPDYLLFDSRVRLVLNC